MNKRILILFLVLFSVYTVWFLQNGWAEKPKVAISADKTSTLNLWKYECLDTMKTSRDKARMWTWKILDDHITSQVNATVAMGANCIAIDTPYDEEFLPVLKKWVAASRERNLHIWFRGNFSSWEGWFEYPTGMTANEHIQKTNAFIADNPNLFADGDIFTPSPEAENGGPFNQVETDEHAVFREYLIREYQEAQNAFKKIGKNVEVNWLSMNGGLAQRMMDQKTVDAVGKVVAIDHYIKTPQEMGEFIRYFYNTFGAQVVIGEWGAPIPQINGEMTEAEQADFVRALLEEQYRYKKMVHGTSYWVLYDGSTSLLNPDGSEREVVEVIRDYFIPGRIQGRLTDKEGKPIVNASIVVGDRAETIYTDLGGNYEVTAPAGNVRLAMKHKDFRTVIKNVTLKRDTVYKRNYKLTPVSHAGFMEKIQDRLRGLFR